MKESTDAGGRRNRTTRAIEGVESGTAGRGCRLFACYAQVALIIMTLVTISLNICDAGHLFARLSFGITLADLPIGVWPFEPPLPLPISRPALLSGPR